MKTKHIILLFFIVSFLQLSCTKLVDVDPPPDRVVKEMVFTNDATALSAMSGLYTQMIRTSTQFSSSAITLYAGLYADELYAVNPSSNVDEYYNNALLASNGTLRTNLWLPAYQIIFQANNIIEGLSTSTGVSAGTKKQLEGEAKFIRAFCHFYLAALYGDVPLITSTDYRINATAPRTAVTDLYDQVISDLQEAKVLTGNTYPSAARARINSYAASALLARVYLYKGEWQKAETEASRVINEPQYGMVANMANVFLSTSTETIWQLMPVSANINTWEGNLFVPGINAAPAYPLSHPLGNSFSVTDGRKTNWTKTVTIGSNTYHYPYKYKVKTAATVTEYYVVLRLAEQYLIRTEARARLGNIAGAKMDLNVIRSRAGLGVDASNDIVTLLTAIENERRLELFAEWGHRLFDLKRTNRADAVLPAVKPGWNATDALLPIPSQELNRNPKLTQNPGY